MLNENVDAGADPKEIFNVISSYCAHDLNGFLYNYILDQLDSESWIYASDLLDALTPYFLDPLSLEFLHIRLLFHVDPSLANHRCQELLKHEISLPLLMDVLHFLALEGDCELFKIGVKQVLPLIQEHNAFNEVLVITASYYRRLDQGPKEQRVKQLMQTGPISLTHLQELKKLIMQ